MNSNGNLYDGGTLAPHARRFSVLRALDLPHLAFAVLFLWLLAAVQLTDPDYYWHLEAGEYIVNHMALPSGDPFSYTFRGQPWALHEWLFEVALYAIFAAFGTSGVKLLTAALGVLSTYIAYRAARRLLGASTLALALAIVFVAIQAGGFSPRPQLVTYVLFAAFVYLLVAFKYFGEDRRLWLIPPLLVLWVNSHGGYIIGLALLIVFCGLEWLRYFAFRDAENRRRLIRLSAFTVAGGLATLLNPDGIGGWLFPFQVMNMDFANSVIAEWQSPNFRTLQGKLYLVLTFGFFLLSVYRYSKPDLTEIGLPLFFLFAGFVSVRHMPLAALILIPFAAVALRDSPARGIYHRATGGKQLGNIEYVLNWVILLLAGALFLGLNPRLQAQGQTKLNRTLPVAAADFIERHGISGRMFNDYAHGGYLIHRLYPRQRVFIDGRADIYGDTFIKEFLTIRNGAPGWDKAFDKYSIDYVVIQRDAPILERLLARGDFTTIYEDAAHSVTVRKNSAWSRLEFPDSTDR